MDEGSSERIAREARAVAAIDHPNVVRLFGLAHDEPRPPRQLNDAIPHDLATICLKAMSKEPARRYTTAEDLANDLDNWLTGRTISARPVSRVERLVRWARRNTRVAVLAAPVCLLLTLMAVGGTAAAVHMRSLKQLADQQRDIAFDTLQAMVFDVYDRLDEGEDPTIYQAQREVLLSAISGLNRLPTSPDVSTEIAWTRLAAMARLGSIEYRLDNDQQAYKQLTQVLRLGEELGFSNETIERINYRRVRPLSHAHFFLGGLALQDEDHEKAIEHLTDSLRLDERLIAAKPERIDFHVELISSLASLVETTFDAGDDQSCMVYAARCETAIAHVESMDEDADYEVALAYLPDVLRFWGTALIRQGELGLARQKLTEAAELLSDTALDDEMTDEELILIDEEHIDVQANITAALISIERREGNADRAAELAKDQENRFDALIELAKDLEDDEFPDWIEFVRSEFRKSTKL